MTFMIIALVLCAFTIAVLSTALEVCRSELARYKMYYQVSREENLRLRKKLFVYDNDRLLKSKL